MPETPEQGEPVTRTIWKYEIDVTDTIQLELPGNAVVLPIVHATNPTTLNLWAEVDPHLPAQLRTFEIVGTGHPLPDGVLSYISSVVAAPFVWHVYEVVAR